MKKGFKRAISLILCLAMLAGATAVTCHAAKTSAIAAIARS